MRRKESTRIGLIVAVSAVVGVGIFIWDLSMPLGVAAGVPYVALVLISLQAPWRHYATLLATVSTVLVVIGYFFSPSLGTFWVVITNRLLAVSAVWVAAAFCLWRNQAEQALRESEALYSALFEHNPVETLVVDHEGRITAFNSARRRSGSRLPQVGELMYRDYAGKHEIDMHAELMECIRTGQTKEFPEQKYEDTFLTIKLAPFPNGAIITTQDITERKRAEEELARVFDLSPDMICTASADGFFKSLNPAWEEVLGFTREELLAKPFRDFLHPDDIDATIGTLEDQVAGKAIMSFENRYRCKDGSYRTLEWRGTTAVEGLVYAIARDVTERKRAEKDVKSAKEFLSGVINSIDDPVSVKDINGRYIMINNSSCDVWGRKREDLEMKTDHDLFPKDVADIMVAEDIQMRKDGKAILSEIDVELRGQLESYSIKKSVYSDLATGEEFIVGVARNITELKRAEEERQRFEAQMQQTQKLESLGVMAGGIAHDFNNILYAILGNADLALGVMSPQAPGREHLHEIQAAARRASELTNQMLAYSGKGALAKEKLDLSELVQEMAHLLEVSHTKKAIVKYRFDKDLPAIDADPSQLRQVVMNLITNASEAIGDEGGSITVTTGVTEATQEYLAATYVDDELPGGRYVYLEVTDTGCGMDEETRRRMFEPFFTTKFTGRGLGMAAVLGILRAHNGAIDIDSEVGRGTIIRVLFPALDGPAEPPAEGASQEEDWRGTGTILVVDDERQVQLLQQLILQQKGFTVLTAKDGKQAIEVFRDNKDDIACVLLDLTMPHMGGEETFVKLRQIRADVPVVLVSGYSEKQLKERVKDLGFAGFLKKPVESNLLLEKMRDIAGGSR